MRPPLGYVGVRGPEKTALFFRFKWHTTIVTKSLLSGNRALIAKREGR